MENIRDIVAKEDSYRVFESAGELVGAWSRNPIVWSWGAHNWQMINTKVLRFRVNGHHHKGHVWIMVNGNDLFDVFLTTSQGNIVRNIKDVYIEDLTEAVDIAVEKIALYKY